MNAQSRNLPPNRSAASYRPHDPAVLQSQCDYLDRAPHQSAEIADKALAGTWSIQVRGKQTLWPDVTGPLESLWDGSAGPNESWSHVLHSLEILMDLRIAHAERGDDRYLDLGERIVEAWITGNPRGNPPNPFSWGDHSTANRAMNLCAFVDHCLAHGHPPHRLLPRLGGILAQHAAFLADDANYTFRHNHGIFQDFAILVIVSHLDGERRSGRWRDKALRRMLEQVRQTFSPNGVHLENSPGYHLAITRQVGIIDAYGRAVGAPLPPELHRTVELATAAAGTFVLPDGCVAPVGDTARERTVDDFPIPEAPAFTVHRCAGYGIVRDAACVFFAASHNSHTHKHCDDLTVLVGDAAGLILSDPGFLNYQPNDPQRDFTRSWAGHNVLTADTEPPLQTSQRCGIEAWGEAGEWACLVGRSERGSLTHRRCVLVHRPSSLVLLVDEGHAGDRSERHWQRWFHFEANVSVEALSPGALRLRRAKGADWSLTRSPADGPWEVVTGQRDPLQGWLARRFIGLVPAPAAVERARGEHVRLVAVLSPGETPAELDAPAPDTLHLRTPAVAATITFADAPALPGRPPAEAAVTIRQSTGRDEREIRIALTPNALHAPLPPFRLHWRRRVCGILRRLRRAIVGR